VPDLHLRSKEIIVLGRLNHVGIVVPDLEKAASLYRDVFGATVSAPQPLPSHGVTVVFVDLPNAKLELLEPLGEKSPVAGFLAKNPAGGMNHMCFEVANLIEERDALRAKGVHILGTGEPTNGAHEKPVLFVHPKDVDGCLVELEQV
jgi:methylmalonyl-CoA/ethylmalonyl-CoA epimerase